MVPGDIDAFPIELLRKREHRNGRLSVGLDILLLCGAGQKVAGNEGQIGQFLREDFLDHRRVSRIGVNEAPTALLFKKLLEQVEIPVDIAKNHNLQFSHSQAFFSTKRQKTFFSAFQFFFALKLWRRFSSNDLSPFDI